MKNKILEFEKDLYQREKSRATAEKYLRDVKAFLRKTKGNINKESVLLYKEYICENYLPRSVNSMLSSVNCYLDFIGRSDCKVKAVKVQKRTFADSVFVLFSRKKVPKSVGGLRFPPTPLKRPRRGGDWGGVGLYGVCGFSFSKIVRLCAVAFNRRTQRRKC